MRMISPQVDAPQVTIAEEQEEYKPITAARVVYDDETGPKHSLLFAFRPSDEERARLARGDDVYIGQLTFGQPMQPILVLCGKEEAARAFGIQVAP